MIKRVLIVDDEPLIVKGLKFSLEQEGYETDCAYSGEEALEKFHNSPFCLTLCFPIFQVPRFAMLSAKSQ